MPLQGRINLNTLILVDNKIDFDGTGDQINESLNWTTKLKNLTTLHLGGRTTILKPINCVNLHSLTKLRSLHLNNSKFTSANLQNLFQNLPRIEDFSFIHGKFKHLSCLDPILTQIKQLDVSLNRALTDINKLYGSNNIQSLNLLGV